MAPLVVEVEVEAAVEVRSIEVYGPMCPSPALFGFPINAMVLLLLLFLMLLP
jgi:hypothetical protein